VTAERRNKLLEAAEKAGLDPNELSKLEGWDGEYLELVTTTGGNYCLTAGDATIEIPELIGARLGLALDNVGVEFEQDLPTELISRDETSQDT
jgi:hypothetical protein